MAAQGLTLLPLPWTPQSWVEFGPNETLGTGIGSESGVSFS